MMETQGAQSSPSPLRGGIKGVVASTAIAPWGCFDTPTRIPSPQGGGRPVPCLPDICP